MSSLPSTPTASQPKDYSALHEVDSATRVAKARAEGVTWRVAALCLGLAALFGYVIPVIDVKMVNTYLGSTHLPPGAVGVLLLMLLVINPLLKTLWRRAAFSRNEILVVYITCLFSTLVPGHAAENLFVSQIIGSFYFATRENGWLDFLQPYLKPYLSPALNSNGVYDEAGQKLVDGWYLGTGGAVPWGAWLVPLLVWASLVFASYLMLGCLSVMLRAQWGEREALAFPLLRLPLEMTEDEDNAHNRLGRFFREPMMWLGFGIAVLIELINGLNLYFSDVPRVPMELSTTTLLTEAPWNQIGDVSVFIYPLAVGVSYLLTLEISFSLWFFFWFIKGQYLVAAALGFMPQAMAAPLGFPPAKAFTGYQVIGAYFAYVAMVLWTARHHLQHVAQRALARTPARAGEENEALSYPTAFWGFFASFAFVMSWCVAAGIRWDIALALWISYLVMAIALTRLVVEGGLIFVSKGWSFLGTAAQLGGSGPGTWLPAQSIVPASFVQSGMMHDMRGFLMPSFMQSFKLARDQGIASRRLWLLIFACIAVSMSIGWRTSVVLGYQNGGLQLEKWYAGFAAQLPALTSKAMVNGASDVSWANWGWMGVGGAITYAMMLARSRWLWFPLHPLGYLLNMPYAIQRMWFSIFLGWLAKVLITRYGGNDTYRKLMPAFLGLALGSVAMMLFWLVVDGWQGRTNHLLMPQ